MFARAVIRHRVRDEGEKPFWISFSDLMTACMTVFLIVMALTVVAMKDEVDKINKSTEFTRARQTDIESFAEILRENSREWPKVKVSTVKDVVRVELGAVVNFVSGSADITPGGSKFLRAYLPQVLAAADTDVGQKWLKRVVVEGFTDADGTYLFNLDLSFQRGRKVVCTMYEQPASGERKVTQEELEKIRDLFLVGGYSFNSMKESKAKSRRVDLRLEFWQVGEKDQADKQPKPDLAGKAFGKC